MGELLEELCWILEEVRGILEDKRIWGCIAALSGAGKRVRGFY
ncbi:hypothetical protein NYE67_16795 [Solibacillus sp. FSL W8-0474]